MNSKGEAEREQSLSAVRAGNMFRDITGECITMRGAAHFTFVACFQDDVVDILARTEKLMHGDFFCRNLMAKKKT